jgi:hypothetical protein
VLGVAEVVLHLRLGRRLQHCLGQPRQQAARTDELDALTPRPFDQLLRERPLDRPPPPVPV